MMKATTILRDPAQHTGLEKTKPYRNVAEPEGESARFGDFLLHFLGHATFTEMLRTIHEVYARKAGASTEEIIKLLNERIAIPEKVNAALDRGWEDGSKETS